MGGRSDLRKLLVAPELWRIILTDIIEQINKRYLPFLVKADGCWKWSGRKLKDGRGVVWLNGKNVTAPRVAWYLKTGNFISDRSVLVCHTCDVPECCNPDHLFLGTVSDNALDASSKKRLYVQRNPHECFFAKNPYVKARGEDHGRAKLTAENVLLIRSEYDKDNQVDLNEFADKFGVTRFAVVKVVQRKTWKHV
jgi:hypothetical protein